MLNLRNIPSNSSTSNEAIRQRATVNDPQHCMNVHRKSRQYVYFLSNSPHPEILNKRWSQTLYMLQYACHIRASVTSTNHHNRDAEPPRPPRAQACTSGVVNTGKDFQCCLADTVIAFCSYLHTRRGVTCKTLYDRHSPNTIAGSAQVEPVPSVDGH
jgi:hypothetical protein